LRRRAAGIWLAALQDLLKLSLAAVSAKMKKKYAGVLPPDRAAKMPALERVLTVPGKYFAVTAEELPEGFSVIALLYERRGKR